MNIPNNTGVYMIVNDTSRLNPSDTRILNNLPHGVLLAEHKHRNSYKNVKVLISEGDERAQAINYYNRIGIKIKGLIKIDLSTRTKEPSEGTIHDNFDAAYYMSNYPDIVAAGFNTPQLAYEHYIRHGKKEGRLCKTPLPAKQKPPVVWIYMPNEN